MLKSGLAAVAGVMLFAGSALATPITGSIGFTSGYHDVWQAVAYDALPGQTAGDVSTWATSTIANADGMLFQDVDVDTYNGYVGGGRTGTFAAVAGGTGVNFTDFGWTPFTGPVVPLWTFTDVATNVTFTFDLSAVTLTSRNSTGLQLDGVGVFASDNNLESAYGSMVIITNNATWSATAEVPEPATMLLFGSGLVGLAAVSRRRNKK